MKEMQRGCLVFGILIASIATAMCQNVLQFTGVNATPQKSVILHWQSNTNEIYGIEYADTLIDTNTGTTTWKPLYDDYPSQGTNTLWQDAGNDYFTPFVPHPITTDTRFYRVVYQGTNTVGDGLTVSINGLTNGSVVSGDIAVSVTAVCSDFVTGLLLYLDGKELPLSPDGTNFTFNTCESWNGAHTLFAVAKSQSGLAGFRGDADVTVNHAVSLPINISIQNLITDFYHSQGFFQPSLGQTQQVSASFTANCDWTLQIFDPSSNAVRTVTGNGKGMNFQWDGTDDGGTNVPASIYTYILSAETNAPSSLISEESYSISEGASLWAVQDGTEYPVPFAIFPIGFDTNTLTIFSATQFEIDELIGDTELETLSEESKEFSFANILGAAGSSQSTSFIGPVEKQGTVGITYQTYAAQILTTRPLSGSALPATRYIAIDDDNQGRSAVPFRNDFLGNAPYIADKFSYTMEKKNGYLTTFKYANDDVKTNDLKKTSLGGNSIFNTVNFGLMISHGSYGTVPAIDGVFYTYLWIENRAASMVGYLRLSDFSFGGSEPDGLRWMTILGCGVLNENCWNSMVNNSRNSINSNLHVLLSASTTIHEIPDLGQYYALALSQDRSIINAWYVTGRTSYATTTGTNIIGKTIKFASVVRDNCVGDTLRSYTTSPSGGLTFDDEQIYP